MGFVSSNTCSLVAGFQHHVDYVELVYISKFTQINSQLERTTKAKEIKDVNKFLKRPQLHPKTTTNRRLRIVLKNITLQLYTHVSNLIFFNATSCPVVLSCALYTTP